MRLRIFIPLFSLLFSLLACRWSGVSTPSVENLLIRTEDALAVEEKLEQAIQEANEKGTFTIEITEQQLASYVAFNMDENNQTPISDLQIRLGEEQIWLSGLVQQGDLQLPLTVGLKLGVGSANNVVLEFTQAKIGPFPLPDVLLDTITEEVEKAFAEQLAAVGEGYTLEEITIGEGSILIRGSKR
ncbi:MAG: hypothetical protein Kow0088_00790 [Anaerolineales bacterium]